MAQSHLWRPFTLGGSSWLGWINTSFIKDVTIAWHWMTLCCIWALRSGYNKGSVGGCHPTEAADKASALRSSPVNLQRWECTCAQPSPGLTAWLPLGFDPSLSAKGIRDTKVHGHLWVSTQSLQTMGWVATLPGYISIATWNLGVCNMSSFSGFKMVPFSTIPSHLK